MLHKTYIKITYFIILFEKKNSINDNNNLILEKSYFTRVIIKGYQNKSYSIILTLPTSLFSLNHLSFEYDFK